MYCQMCRKEITVPGEGMASAAMQFHARAHVSMQYPRVAVDYRRILAKYRVMQNIMRDQCFGGEDEN